MICHLAILRSLSLIALACVCAGSASAANKYFNGASSTVWNTSATNWGAASGGPYSSTWATYDTAIFEGTGTAVTVGSVIANTLRFDVNGYTLTGGTIGLGNPTGTNFTVASGVTASISSQISQTYATGLSLNGSGTLNLGGTGNSIASDTIVDNGVLNITGGSTTVGPISIANASSSTNGRLKVSGGTLTTGSLANIGVRGTGVLEQSGGTTHFNNGLALGYYNLGIATSSSATLSDGAMNVYQLFIGHCNTAGSSSIFTQSGGNFTLTGGGLFIGNLGGGIQQLNLNGGTFTATSSSSFLAVRGTASMTVSGTADAHFSDLRFGHPSTNGATGTLHLNGGTVTSGQIFESSGGHSSTLNFNGGTLKPSTDSASFLEGLDSANVRNGGTIVDTNGKNITIAQNLLHSGIGGDNTTDGGLIKRGAGTLTLAGNNTYTGATNVSAGTLRLTMSQAQVPSGLKIMPMGDSITYGGSGTNAGYRGYLRSLLDPIAPNFQFIGASTTNPASLPASPIDQTHHNGYASYATLDLHNNFDGLDLTRYNQLGDASRNPLGGYWITGGNGTGRAAAYPDVVLLMVGTNDIYQQNAYNNPQINVANYATNLTTLINKLISLRPNVRVIVAKITPSASQTANVTAINNSVASVTASLQSQGKAVFLADMNTNFPASGMSGDGVHPNDTGYAWMATQWRDAIVSAVTPPSGTTTAALPAATSVIVAAGATLDLNQNQASIAGLNVSGSVLLGIGKLSTSAPATFAAGSTFAASINRDTPGAGRLAVTGNLTLGNATLNLSSIGTGALNPGTKFTIATYTGALNGTFNDLVNEASLTLGGVPFVIRYADAGKNITLTVANTYQSWISTEHPALTGDDALATADPDFDNLANLIEYALGLDPQTVNANPVHFDQETIGTDKYLRLSVTRDPEASGVVIEGERSANLLPGTWSTAGVIQEVSPPTLFRVRDSQPIASGATSYLRLRFSQN